LLTNLSVGVGVTVASSLLLNQRMWLAPQHCSAKLLRVTDASHTRQSIKRAISLYCPRQVSLVRWQRF